MRYLALLGLLVAVAIVAMAGKRGSLSRRPPIEVFADMDRQPKLRPQSANGFFADGLSSQRPVPGTIARQPAVELGGQAVYPFEEHPFNTGRLPAQTNFVPHIPVPVTGALLARGQERFNIFCAPCHGASGQGNGWTSRLGLVGVADLHQLRLVQMPDGQLFNIIQQGKNRMGGYASSLGPADAWAVTAYVRALQRARLGTLDDVPPEQRDQLLQRASGAGAATQPRQ